MFRNAPAGFIYPGDPGFPAGTSGLNKKWWNLAPRVGIAWDVGGRPPGGSLVVRAYDYPGGEYFNNLAAAPPCGNRTRVTDPAGLFDDPYRDVGNADHPGARTPRSPLAGRSRRWTRTSIPHVCSRGTSASSDRSAPTGASRPAIWAATRIGYGV